LYAIHIAHRQRLTAIEWLEQTRWKDLRSEKSLHLAYRNSGSSTTRNSRAQPGPADFQQDWPMFNLSYARNALVDTRGLETCLDGFLSNFIDFAVLVDVEDPIDQSHFRFPPYARREHTLVQRLSSTNPACKRRRHRRFYFVSVLVSPTRAPQGFTSPPKTRVLRLVPLLMLPN
jgi:hypothetical protein